MKSEPAACEDRRLMLTTFRLDDYDLDMFGRLAADFGTANYAYVVTPNVDHIIRYCEDASFRDLYDAADYVLLDSRFLSHLVRMTKGIHPRVCPGSDLTAWLFDAAIARDDTVVLIGGTQKQAQLLRRMHGLQQLRHFNPPMGFIRDPQAIEACLAFIEAQSPFRFCFLAIGSPQQEIIARALKSRGRARGLTLCIGASINFLTGIERRAPLWVQRLGIEWSFRLLQNPARLARRYLVRGPRIFLLLKRIHFELTSPQ
jgi:exopolysaccharide biosynthesis WecB/TagA/CpsF family protein